MPDKEMSKLFSVVRNRLLFQFVLFEWWFNHLDSCDRNAKIYTAATVMKSSLLSCQISGVRTETARLYLNPHGAARKKKKKATSSVLMFEVILIRFEILSLCKYRPGVEK